QAGGRGRPVPGPGCRRGGGRGGQEPGPIVAYDPPARPIAGKSGITGCLPSSEQPSNIAPRVLSSCFLGPATAYHEACESSRVTALACVDYGERVAIRTRAGATARQARGSRLRAAQQPARLPPGVASVLSVLSSSAVVVDSTDRVLRASAAARAFGL